MSVRYIIPGNPVALVKGGSKRATLHSSAKDLKMRYIVSIENQHENKPLYHGPLKLVIDFFFDVPCKGIYKIRDTDRKSIEQLEYDKKMGTFHTLAPALSSLVRFVEDVAQNILYGSDYSIATIVANKYYDRESRTEFYIQELSDGKHER